MKKALMIIAGVAMILTLASCGGKKKAAEPADNGKPVYKIADGPNVDLASFPKDADRTACTQLLNDRLGEAIRKYPEQYLWAHRRWR